MKTLFYDDHDLEQLLAWQRSVFRFAWAQVLASLRSWLVWRFARPAPLRFLAGPTACGVQRTPWRVRLHVFHGGERIWDTLEETVLAAARR